MQGIKQLRRSKGLTQKMASALTKIPLRTYKNYENDPSKVGTIKYNYIFEQLTKYGLIDETQGVLTQGDIIKGCKAVCDRFEVDRVLLFGVYAKGKAKADSAVDLVLMTDLEGEEYDALVGNLKAALKKRLDIYDTVRLASDSDLLADVLINGMVVYEKNKVIRSPKAKKKRREKNVN